MIRISRDEWGLRLAEATALRATCVRRRVGAVALDARGVVLATGYNGAPRGRPHCLDVPCAGAGFPSGEGLDECASIHAEQNMVARCPDAERIHTVYVTTSPCVPCVKLLFATGARRLVFRCLYQEEALRRWAEDGREWEMIGG